MISLSEEGKNLIKNFEGLMLKAYLDSGGVKTIGWGHALTPNERHITTISKEQAKIFFDRDISSLERSIKNILGENLINELDQKKYDALISFIYNIGIGNFMASNVLKNLKKKQFKEAISFWSKWIRDVKGVVLAGLVTRRKIEINMFDQDNVYMSQLEKDELFKGK